MQVGNTYEYLHLYPLKIFILNCLYCVKPGRARALKFEIHNSMGRTVENLYGSLFLLRSWGPLWRSSGENASWWDFRAGFKVGTALSFRKNVGVSPKDIGTQIFERKRSSKCSKPTLSFFVLLHPKAQQDNGIVTASNWSIKFGFGEGYRFALTQAALSLQRLMVFLQWRHQQQ